MNNQKSIFTLLFFCLVFIGFAQEEESDYVEFNDRNNVVHGVYLGLNFALGEVDDKDTYMGGLKVAYVANQQFEVGFAGKFIYSEQNIFNTRTSENEDLIGGYGGLHLEPILFSKSKVNLSFPLLIGAGAVGYVDRDLIRAEEDVNLDDDDVALLFVLEPGVSALFNINRYLQLEAGVKYRFSNKIDLFESPVERINGFSAGIGIKVGVFNLGRNRYKKKL
ncbi:hypothetical protein FEE95_13075 [Maribacter algarum]|uniref:Outer membrane protein beta-barrel domain-containing protein n=1 Tax=Maribacter algarum (ex Zhang et al. 2020) TaxID=2578118 RepID=A0A5S3PRX4_9FLAO|nr:hypothetical protein [Maribacter algarum]TMM57411.1 hypothetical protein FEE95_13075 [Maribacter algarum]